MNYCNKPAIKDYVLRYSKLPPPQEYLVHHGILGQKWGKKNGPPYPLDAADHSAAEKKAGWRKSLDSGGKREDNKRKGRSRENQNGKTKKGLTDKQKTALKVGAALAATALIAYGGYKLKESGKLDELIGKGKKLAEDVLGKIGDKPVSSFDPAPSSSSKSPLGDIDFSTLSPKQPTASAKPVTEVIHGFKRLAEQESIADTVRKTNPHLGEPKYKSNCTICSITSFLRQAGFDVTAGKTPSEGKRGMNLATLVDECFKGAKTVDGSSVKFAKSRQDAAEMLVKRFGNNAKGVCRVSWKGHSDGHAFSWAIKDGIVSFFDAQHPEINPKQYWDNIDPEGPLFLAQLDTAEIVFDAISKYVEKS